MYNIFVVSLQREIKQMFNQLKMKWIKKTGIKTGGVFVKHSKEHDEYNNPTTGITVQIERHGSQEVRKGLTSKLRKQIGFLQQGRGVAALPLALKRDKKNERWKFYRDHRER